MIDIRKLYVQIKSHKSEAISIALIVFLGLLLRCICLLNCGGMWSDEEVSWLIAKDQTLWMTFVNSFISDLHTPLYYILLHIWIRLFGDGIDTMRWLGFVLTIPLIPVSYFASKRLFNRTTAYFAAIFIAINTFCVYYSIEIRIYALNLILSLLSAYFFTVYLDKFKTRDSIGYIVFMSLLVYNFAIAPLLTVINFIIGILYVLKYKRQYIKNFLVCHGILFCALLPAFIWIALVAYRMYFKTLIYYPLDIFYFKEYHPGIILAFLENFFSFENYHIVFNDIYTYQTLHEKFNFLYCISVFIPIVLCLSGFINVLFSKNKNLYIFLFPSLIFLLSLYVLSSFNLVVTQVRYLTIIFPVFALSVCYGISNFRKNYLLYWVYGILIFFSSLNLIFIKPNIYSIHRISNDDGISEVLNKYVKLSDDDILFIPFRGNELDYYIRHKNSIPFYTQKLLGVGEKKYLLMYFGDEYEKYNKNNVMDLLIDEVLEKVPHAYFDNYLNDNYLRKMEPGQRLILILENRDVDSFISKENLLTKENYKDFNLEDFLYAKLNRDCMLVAQKHLKLIDAVIFNDLVLLIYKK